MMDIQLREASLNALTIKNLLSDIHHTLLVKGLEESKSGREVVKLRKKVDELHVRLIEEAAKHGEKE